MRSYKKLRQQHKMQVDAAITALVANPQAGMLKGHDLAGVRVHKFRIDNHLTLIAYRILDDENALRLLSIGSHENFYRDLKNALN